MKLFSDLRYVLVDCHETESYQVYYFSVRAVNINNNKSYVGPWSQETENYCHAAAENYYSILLAVLLFCGLVILVTLCLLGRWFRDKYLSMKNINVMLPPGLAEKDVQQKNQATKEIINSKISPDIDPVSDDQMLLDTKTDSSGCSSGQESAHSSLESATNLSVTTDSGTEQPPHSTDNKHLNNKGSLRLRKLANYCVVGGIENSCGITVQPEATVANGYVPIAKMVRDELQPSSVGYSTIVPTSKLINLETQPYVTMLESPDAMSLKTDWTSIESEPSINNDYLLSKPYCRLGVDNTVQMVPLADEQNTQASETKGRGYVPHKCLDANILKED